MANIGNIDSIKITQLTNIGSNIAANSLIPVVNMANLSNTITQKSTLQNAANYILNNAGTATFPPALQANIALSVANAAQPNITSVGNLTSLNVSGNVRLPDVSLVNIQGGNNGQFLQTNGNGVLDWAIPPSGNVTNYPGGANTQLQFNNGGTFAGSDEFTFDGNNVAITGANFIANPGAYILQVYGANAYMGSLTDGGVGVGSATTTIDTDTTLITGSNTTIGSSNVWNFNSTTGNLTLPSNTFAVNYANGDQVSLGGTSNTIQDGPSLAYIDGAGGNFVVSISDSDSVWSFGVGGDITFPDGSVQHSAYTGPEFPNVSSNSGKYLTTNGTQLLWATVSGGNGTPGGANTQIQYNDNGAFGGNTAFTIDSPNLVMYAKNLVADTITANTTIEVTDINVNGNIVMSNGNISNANVITTNVVNTANVNTNFIYANNGLQLTGTSANILLNGGYILGASEMQIGNTDSLFVGQNAVLLMTGNSTNYVEAALVNQNSTATGDFTIYTDNGNAEAGYVDMGITGSNYNVPNTGLTQPGDGYFIVSGVSTEGGNLIIATAGTGTTNDIVFGNGYDTGNEVMRFNNTLQTFQIKPNTVSNSTSTGALTVTGGVGVLGNINANAVYTDNYFYANGAPLAVPSGNTSVTTTGNISGGNLISSNTIQGNSVTANYFAGDGGNISNIPGANVIGQVGFANVANHVAGANVSGAVAYATTANSVAAANVSGLGNVALLSKDGNSSNVLYGNGVFAAVPATYGNSNVANYLPNYSGTLTSVGDVTANGTVTANNIASNGNVQVGSALVMYGSNNTIATVNGSAVQFANRVNFNATGNYSIVASGNVSASTYFGAIGTASQTGITAIGTLASLSVSGNANIGNIGTAGVVTATGNISTGGTFVGNGAGLTNVTVNAAGNIQGTSSNVSLVAGSYTYTFDNTGNFTLPSNGDMVFSGNTTLTSVTGSNGNITINPDGTGQLVVTNITPATFGNTLLVAGPVTSTGASNGTGFLVGNGAVNNVALGFSPTAGTAANMAIRDLSTVSSVMYFDVVTGSTANGAFLFRSSNAYTQYARIDGYGITLPTKPGFRVYGAGTTTNLTTTVNTNGILNGNNYAVDYNQGSYLNTTTGIFTAPVAGLYSVHLVARVSNTSSAQIAIVKNYASSNTVQAMWEAGANCTANHFGVSSIVKLAVGDTLVIKVLLGQINFDGNDNWAIAFLG